MPPCSLWNVLNYVICLPPDFLHYNRQDLKAAHSWANLWSDEAWKPIQTGKIVTKEVNQSAMLETRFRKYKERVGWVAGRDSENLQGESMSEPIVLLSSGHEVRKAGPDEQSVVSRKRTDEMGQYWIRIMAENWWPLVAGGCGWGVRERLLPGQVSLKFSWMVVSVTWASYYHV